MPLLGLLQGFQGARDAELDRNYDADKDRRAREGKLYEYLLQSQDPEIQSLALSGLMESAQPSKRAKGFKGFFGELEGGKIYPQIRQLMNQMVPDRSAPAAGAPAAGAPPASPGGAALPSSSPVEPGAPPMLSSVMSPQDQWSGVSPERATLGPPPAAGAPDTGAPPPMPGPPPAPPVSRFKRRGTGIPTAEEIAEANAAAGMRGRLDAATAAFSDPADQRRAKLGVTGAPQPSKTLSAVTQFGVIMPGETEPQPVLLDQASGYTLADGTPLPQGAKMVRMSGSGGGGGVPRTAREPDRNSSTGWSKVFYDTATGAELYRVDDAPVYPPPALSGVTTIYDPESATGRSVTGITRGGQRGPVIGPADPTSAPTQDQINAEALLAEVDKLIVAQEKPRMSGIPGKPLLPQAKDALVAQRARAAGQPYQTYFELQQAAKSRSTVPTTSGVGGGSPGMSLADQVRQRALENRKKAQAPQATPPAPR